MRGVTIWALRAAALGLSLLALAVAGCGGSSTSSAPPSTVQTTAAPPAATASTTTAASPAPALQGEATSAATGDIPDNQVFLTFHDGAAAYSMKYPEGWAQQGSGATVTFRDENNIVRVVVRREPAADPASVSRELAGLTGAHVQGVPQRTTISGARAVKAVYTTRSVPNPVTGKRVTLIVDRYYLWHAGRLAVVDLGTAQGVDNVDAYRLMIESFRWG